MNIWIFNHYANGPGVNGVTRHFDLAKNLVKKGHSVTIFCSSFNHWEKRELIEYKKSEYYKIKWHENVKFVYFKTTNYSGNGVDRIKSMFSFYMQTYKYNYYELNDKPDYIIGSILHHFAAIRAFQISKKFNAKFIFEERDLWPATLIDLGKLSVKNPIVKILDWYESFMYKKASRIIVLFDKASDYVEHKGVAKNKIIYLPNGVDLSNYNLSNRKDIDLNNIVIGYVGAHSLANNLNRIIELVIKLKDNPNIKFRFVGEGTYKKEIMDIARKNNLKNCSFESGVPKEDIPKILEECDFGIVSLKDSPLYNYGFSLNKLYDYMGARLPIILDTTIKETFIEKSNLGIATESFDEIEQFFLNLTKDQYNKMSNNSFDYVYREHNWEKLCDNFIKAIQE